MFGWKLLKARRRPVRRRGKGLGIEVLESRRLLALPPTGAMVTGDFNGDGADDLAVGVPFENIGAIPDAGAVHVIYGSPGGLAVAGNQFWHQNSPGILDASEAGDLFGTSLAAGFFNGDAFEDLAIGVPFEDIATAAGVIADAGVVHILYGSAGGLVAATNQLWHQNSGGVLDTAEAGDNFGHALGTGAFAGGGLDALAIGVPGEDIVSGGVLIADVGASNVLYGTAAAGLTAAGNQFWHQNSGGILDVIEPGDMFAWSVAGGDLNGDGFADVAYGIPFEDIGAVPDAGAVQVLYGSAAGLSAVDQFWNQNSGGIADVSEPGDFFGHAVDIGNLNGDAFGDLAVGAPGEDLGALPIIDAGAVHTIFGAGGGLLAAGNQFWHQNSAGILDVSEVGDFFGSSLAIGNFNGDAVGDLAIGVRFEDVPIAGGMIPDAGAVNVILGAAGGLVAAGNQFWHQNSGGVLDMSEPGDYMGSGLAAGDFNGDGFADLAIGVAGEDLISPAGAVIPDAGAMNVLMSAGAAGLTPAGNLFGHQDTPGILDGAEPFDGFSGP